MEDSYQTVGFKLISAFKWISNSSRIIQENKLKWIIKLDDDILLNVDQIQKYIKYETNEDSIHCHMYHYVSPYRSFDSKW